MYFPKMINDLFHKTFFNDVYFLMTIAYQLTILYTKYINLIFIKIQNQTHALKLNKINFIISTYVLSLPYSLFIKIP